VQQIELFNRAFNQAWPQIGSNERLTAEARSRAALLLRDIVQRRIKAGETDAALIATAAVAEVRQRGMGYAGLAH